MNIYSHAHIAIVLQHHLKTNYNINLPKKSFVTSNCRPDFSVKYKKIPHYEKYMYDEVKGMIVDLANSDKSKLNAYYISDRLGVICHFLCDFFCYAHTDRFKGTLSDHFKYEAILNKHIKLRRITLKKINFLLSENLSKNVKNILLELDNCMDDYNKCKPNPAVDLVFSMQACENVIVPLVYIMVLKSQLSTRRFIEMEG